MADGVAGVGDHYAALGVSLGASQVEIHTAFRRLAREYHPDVNRSADAAERFRTVVAAYEVLSDPGLRAAYDAQRRRRTTGTGRAAPAGTSAAGRTGRTGRTTGGTQAGGAAAWQTMPPVRGLDRHDMLRVSAELLDHGGMATLGHRRWERCSRCGGFGRLEEEVPCPVCGGSGFHDGRLSDPCRVCWTSGTTTVCPDCGGKGGVWRAKHLEITIRPGMRYGQPLRLRGMGDAGPRGGPPGDLYVELAPPLPAAVQAVASHELIQAALRRLEEWLDRFAPYPAT